MKEEIRRQKREGMDEKGGEKLGDFKEGNGGEKRKIGGEMEGENRRDMRDGNGNERKEEN